MKNPFTGIPASDPQKLWRAYEKKKKSLMQGQNFWHIKAEIKVLTDMYNKATNGNN